MMSKPQVEALALLAQGPQRSTTHAAPGYIGGTTAHALQRRGWAAYDSVRGGCTWWVITPAGRHALVSKLSSKAKPPRSPSGEPPQATGQGQAPPGHAPKGPTT